jgi:hypothetical protein
MSVDVMIADPSYGTVKVVRANRCCGTRTTTVPGCPSNGSARVDMTVVEPENNEVTVEKST